LRKAEECAPRLFRFDKIDAVASGIFECYVPPSENLPQLPKREYPFTAFDLFGALSEPLSYRGYDVRGVFRTT